MSGSVVHSEHRIDILNEKSSWKEHLKVFITERFTEKTVYFWDPVKRSRKSHQKFSKKNCPKKFHNIHRKTPVLESLFICVGVAITLSKRDFSAGVFL